MTTREYREAYMDDSDQFARWAVQDAQMPPNDSDVAHLWAEIKRLRAEIAALKVETALTMSWYKTVCELNNERTAERDAVRVEIVRLQTFLPALDDAGVDL